MRLYRLASDLLQAIEVRVFCPNVGWGVRTACFGVSAGRGGERFRGRRVALVMRPERVSTPRTCAARATDLELRTENSKLVSITDSCEQSTAGRRSRRLLNASAMAVVGAFLVVLQFSRV